MESICMQCNQAVKTLKFIQCKGFCGKVAHLDCVSLSRGAMDLINEQANLFWFCNDCTAIMKSKHVRDAFATLNDAFLKLSDTHSTALK